MFGILLLREMLIADVDIDIDRNADVDEKDKNKYWPSADRNSDVDGEQLQKDDLQ